MSFCLPHSDFNHGLYVLAHTRMPHSGLFLPLDYRLLKPSIVFSLTLLLPPLLFTVPPNWLALNLLHFPSYPQLLPFFFPLLKLHNRSYVFFYNTNHNLPHCALVIPAPPSHFPDFLESLSNLFSRKFSFPVYYFFRVKFSHKLVNKSILI